MAENLFGGDDAGADLSPDGMYRWNLWRRWDEGPAMGIIMLNPSTADAELNDNTIRRLIGFAKREGCHAIVVRNLFAYRTKSPKILREAHLDGVDVVGEMNDWWIDHLLTDRFGIRPIIAGWGKPAAWAAPRIAAVAERFRNRLSAFDPDPYRGPAPHPLYLKEDTPLVPFPAKGDSHR